MVSIKILAVTALLAVASATFLPHHHHHGHHSAPGVDIVSGVLSGGHGSVRHGRPLSCFGRFHGGIAASAGIAGDIFLNLADREYPGSFDDALDVILTATRGGSLIIDVGIPNLGGLFRRMIIAASRLSLCVHNLLELPLDILRSVLTGGDDQHSLVCNYGYGKRWGWLLHQCDYSSTRAIIEEYNLWNIRSQIDTCIRDYNGGDINSLSGSYRVIVDTLYDLAGLFEDSERAWTKDDFSFCISNFLTITGAVCNSYDGKLGFTAIDALYDFLHSIIEDKGFGFSTSLSTIKGKMNRCSKHKFNGAFNTKNVNTNNDQGSTDEDDSDYSDYSDADTEENESNDSSDKQTKKSDKNKKSKSNKKSDKSKKTKKSKSNENNDDSDSAEESKSDKRSDKSNKIKKSTSDKKLNKSNKSKKSKSDENSDESENTDKLKSDKRSNESKNTKMSKSDNKSSKSNKSKKSESNQSNDGSESNEESKSNNRSNESNKTEKSKSDIKSNESGNTDESSSNDSSDQSSKTSSADNSRKSSHKQSSDSNESSESSESSEGSESSESNDLSNSSQSSAYRKGQSVSFGSKITSGHANEEQLESEDQNDEGYGYEYETDD